jgi:hypothetical protein
MMSDGKFIDDFEIDDISNVKMRSIYEYWLKIRGDRALPSREDINPADITSILPHITLVRVEESPRRYKLTLIGSENVKVTDGDLTGKYLDEIPLLHQHAKKRYDWVVENKRPYIFQGELNWSRKEYLDYSIIGLPLSDDNEEVEGIMFAGFYYFPDDEANQEAIKAN